MNYEIRDDGFGNNVFETEKGFKFVLICPKCRYNREIGYYNSVEEAKGDLEMEIYKHKKECSGSDYLNNES